MADAGYYTMTFDGVPLTGTITNGLISMSSGDGWAALSPKADKLDTVKLTKDNLEAIAKSVVRKGGPLVQVYSDYFIYGSDTFAVGDWLVREWDYKDSCARYRLATLTEREKYDLR